jgi:hypothetical protein
MRLLFCLKSQLQDAVIHGTASDVEFTMLESLKLIILESLGAEQVFQTNQYDKWKEVGCKIVQIHWKRYL